MTPEDCKSCLCPGGPGARNQFATKCALTNEKEDSFTCTDCEKGYTGTRCERCDDGYFGNPMVSVLFSNMLFTPNHTRNFSGTGVFIESIIIKGMPLLATERLRRILRKCLRWNLIVLYIFLSVNV